MKKVYTLLSALLLGTFLIGCSNEEDLLTEQTKQVTIVAQQEGYSTNVSRSVIYDGTEAGNNYVFMQWEPQDKIGVISVRTATGENPDNNSCFTNTTEANSNKATFNGTLGFFDNTCKFYAYYPYKQGTCTQIIDAPIDQRFVYRDKTSLAKYDHKVADNVTYDPQVLPGTDKFKPYVVSASFKQLTSLLRYNLNLADIKQLITTKLGTVNLSNCKLKRVKIVVVDSQTKEYVPLTGAFTYELTKADKGLTLQGFDPTMENSLTVDIEQAPSLDQNDFNFYAVVAPNKTLNKKMVCNVIVGNETSEYDLQFGAKVLVNLEPGRFYHIDINQKTFTKAEQYSPTDVIVSENKLQVEETANCYMISTVGQHSFNANVIGNGQKGIIPNRGFHTETAEIHPKSAKLLWQDIDNFISEVKLDNKGWVNYKANKNVGNAVIAVYDGSNGTGNILWSWHIWGIGDEPMKDEVITNMAGFSFTIMDRTLGAHSKSSYTATLYQWGRKDPFPNASMYYPGEGAAAVAIEQTFPVMNSDVLHPVVDFIQNPDKIMHSTSASYGEFNSHFWGDGNTADHYDFGEYPDYGEYYKNQRADNRWLNKKTIYDPSPVGYRVANRYTFTGFIKIRTAVGKSHDDVNARYKEGNLYELDFANGYYFFKNKDDKTGMFFPLCGRRTESDGCILNYPYNNSKKTSYGQDGYYWTSGYGKYETQVEAPMFEFHQPSNLDKIPNGYTPKYSEFNACYVTGIKGIGACAVRCVRDDESLVVNK